MITTKDIGKQFTFGSRIVTLEGLETFKTHAHPLGRLDAWVHDPNTPNPANIPGLEYFWVNLDDLTPVEGN